VTPSLSVAQYGSVPKKEREIHGVDFRVVKSLFQAAEGPSVPLNTYKT
jgi:predicted transcriptional regulator of viral defense system